MSNRNRNFTFFEGLVILVVMLNNFFIPISTAGHSIWHFLYWLVSFSAFAMFTLFYEEKLNETGRIVIRPSGTEPLIRVMIEGENEKIIKEYAQKLADFIKEKMN